MHKSKYLRPLWIFIFVLFQFFLCFPSQSISAQDQDEAPDFVVTLALMAVADDRLDEVIDTPALSNLRAVVDEYYAQKSYLQMDADTAAALNHQKTVVLSALDKKIENQRNLTYRAQVGLFIVMADSTNDMYQKDPAAWGSPYDIYNGALSSGYSPDPEVISMLQQRLSASTQTALQHDLNGNLAASVDGGRVLVQQSSDNAYDFDAGFAQGAEDIQHKPLVFTNQGATPVRVVIEYYQPPQGHSIAAPGLNIEIPGNGSVTLDGFPQGNYVFCFDWETDLDRNGDGINDYDRAVVRGWVSAGHPDDPQQAHAITVSASYSDTPTGRCDGFKGEAPTTETALAEQGMTEDDPEPVVVEPTEEDNEPQVDLTEEDPPADNDSWGDDDGGSPGADFWDQGGGSDEDSSEYVLTAGEQANQGHHAYETVCYENGQMSDTTYFGSSWTFSSDGVTLDGTYFYARISANVYKNSEGTTITFLDTGFHSDTYYTETSSEGVATTTRRSCTALLSD